MALSDDIRLRIILEGNREAARALRQLQQIIDELERRNQQQAQQQAGIFDAAGQRIASFAQQQTQAQQQIAQATAGAAAAATAAAQQQQRAAAQQGQAQRQQQGQTQTTTLTTQQFIDVQRRANTTVIDFSRIAQDAAFGLRAMINNFDPIILNLQRLREAAAAGTGQVASLSTTLALLGRSLASPAGLLLLVNLLFTIGTLTGVFDPIAKAVKELFGAFLSTADAADEMEERIRGALAESVRLSRTITVTEAVTSWEDLNDQIQEAERRLGALQRRRIADVIGAAPVGAIRSFLATDPTRQAIDELEEQLRRLRTIRDAFAGDVEEFRTVAEALLLGDPAVVEAQNEEIVDKVREAGIEILEARRRSGVINLALERQIAAARLAIRREETEREIEATKAFFAELGTLEADLIRAVHEAAAEAARTGRQELVQQAALTLRAFQVFSGTLLDQVIALGDSLAEAERQSEAELALKAGDLARRFRRTVEDLTTETERLRTELLLENVDRRLAIIDLETRERRRALERQREDLAREGLVSPAVNAAILDQLRTLDELRLRQRDDALREERAAERDHVEALRRIREAVLLQIGADEEATIARRIERQRQVLASEILTAEQRREIIEEIAELEADAERAQAARFREQQARQAELLRLERESLRQQEEFNEALREAALSGITLDASALLQSRLERLRREFEAAKAIAEQELDLQERILAVRRALAAEDTSDEERERLRAELAALEIQREQAVEASRDVFAIQNQIRDTLVDIAQAEREIWEGRLDQVERFAARLGEVLAEALFFQRELSDLEISASRSRLETEEAQLAGSLRRREISAQEHSSRLLEISNRRAELEKRVEEDRAGFAERLRRGAVEVVRQTASEIISEGIGLTARLLVQQLVAAQITRAVMTATAQQITASFTPAATLASTATFGAAAAAGAAAILGALSTVRTAAAAFFAGGGYTGAGPEREAAGIVHRGEFVLTKRAVQGQPAVFYTLQQALHGGLRPADLLDFLKARGYRSREMVSRAAGLEYQAGGLVAGSQVGLVTSPAGGNREVVQELRTLGTKMDRLSERVTGLEIRARAVVSRREARDLQLAASDYDKRKRRRQ